MPPTTHTCIVSVLSSQVLTNSIGFSFSLFPCWFLSRAVLATGPSGLFNVDLLLPPLSAAACLQNFSFQISLGHQMCGMLLRHLLTHLPLNCPCGAMSFFAQLVRSSVKNSMTTLSSNVCRGIFQIMQE